jgi:acetolactate synthase I/III small subunit
MNSAPYILSLNFNNNPGMIIRAALVFERRGHAISSLKINQHAGQKEAEMLIKASGDPARTEQIIRQLGKLIDVISVKQLSEVNITSVLENKAVAEVA